ncbi:hypothetical protein GCM10020218_022330 [Dactylosporangium vinaceum]
MLLPLHRGRDRLGHALLPGPLGSVGHRADRGGQQVEHFGAGAPGLGGGCHGQDATPRVRQIWRALAYRGDMKRTRVVYRKYDGSLHWNYETDLLGEVVTGPHRLGR